MDIIYLDDITGTIGQWLNEGFDEEVPVEVTRLLQEVYRLSAEELKN